MIFDLRLRTRSQAALRVLDNVGIGKDVTLFVDQETGRRALLVSFLPAGTGGQQLHHSPAPRVIRRRSRLPGAFHELYRTQANSQSQ